MKTKLKVGERYYYEQVGSNAVITGTLIDKETFERDKKVAGGTWHDKISDIQRELRPIKKEQEEISSECNNCGEKIKREEFYCKKCKQKELKKFERQRKANEKRQGESEVRKFNAYLKSGRRTY